MIEVIDFEDKTIDVVVERIAFLGIFVDVFDDFFHSIKNATFMVGAEAKVIEVFQRIGMDVHS